MPRATRTRLSRLLTLCLSLIVPAIAAAQATPRDFRIDVRDKDGRPIADALITFFLTGDSARTDSSGIARATVNADTAINITVRKVGFEQRNARFIVGRAPAFGVRVALGEAGQRLAEVEVTDLYPGEPWRKLYEVRRKRGGGQFRDIAYFPGGVPFSMNDWFNGLPGVRTGGGPGSDINISRCRNTGVWIDGQHATSPGNGLRAALQGMPPQDIAAFELYTSSTPAQFTGQNEDCSLVIWTRLR